VKLATHYTPANLEVVQFDAGAAKFSRRWAAQSRLGITLYYCGKFIRLDIERPCR
jgi:hypothetical protein